ncbi:MAG: hypothetical protein CMK32_02640 [Porticoccaceae bacterium]|nr:hypothetical protein [Porticoccaceae bacterium]
MKSGVLAVIVALFAATLVADEAVRRREYSGIAEIDGHLTIVDDQVNGQLIRLQATIDPSQDVALVPVTETGRTSLKQNLATDLESVGVLADGRVVALSERLRCLIDQQGRVIQYPEIYNEIGNRGLEGLAIRAEGRNSQIAVCWEGGYLQPNDVALELRNRLMGVALHPVVLMHKLSADARPVEMKGVPAYTVRLDSPVEGYRFRMPDLEWIQMPSGDWGLIGLVSAENPRATKNRFRFHRLVLLKPDHSEKTLVSVGAPIELSELLGELGNANWEGICWWNDHTIVLCYDSFPPGPPRIAVINLRKVRPDWLHSSAR